MTFAVIASSALVSRTQPFARLFAAIATLELFARPFVATSLSTSLAMVRPA